MAIEDIKYLKVLCGEYIEFQPHEYNINGQSYENVFDIIESNLYPDLIGERVKGFPELKLVIDVKSGEVINWPKGNPQDFYDLKIVDGGRYSLIGENGEMLFSYDGYVPKCLSENKGTDFIFGDYFEFNIDSDSKIEHWSFDESDIKDFINNGSF